MVKNLPAVQEPWVQSLGQENPLEKGMATHSRILVWRTSWTEEPGGLQSMGLQRVRHNWVTNTLTFLFSILISQVTLVVKNPPANAGDMGLILGSGRSPGEENGNPLQHSCLENPTDREAWQAIVHGVAKSQTWLKWLSTQATVPFPLAACLAPPLDFWHTGPSSIHLLFFSTWQTPSHLWDLR